MLPELERVLAKCRKFLEESPPPELMRGTVEEATATWQGLVTKFEEFNAAALAARKAGEKV